MKILKTLTAVMALLITFGVAESAMAAVGTIYGPVYLSRGNAPMNLNGTTESFSAVPGTIGELVITNGGDTGKVSRVSSATVTLNGNMILGPKDFSKKVGEIKVDVPLELINDLRVNIKSCNSCELIIRVDGELVFSGGKPSGR